MKFFSNAILAALLCGVASTMPGIAQAQAWELKGYTSVSAASVEPGLEQGNDSQRFDVYGAQALQAQALNIAVSLSDGGQARARVIGALGTLKAFASAAYPAAPQAQGLSNGFASVSFLDTITVQGAGLAVGTPVSYQVDFAIGGNISPALGPNARLTEATAEALVRLLDTSSNQRVELGWNPRFLANGLYSLTLATEVGHQLALSGFLTVNAKANSGTPLGEPTSALADFEHSAYFNLAPSVAGLNTVGLSGHDFAVAAVPEPATWLSLLAGLGLLAWRRKLGAVTR
jgi:hypothetical protein